MKFILKIIIVFVIFFAGFYLGQNYIAKSDLPATSSEEINVNLMLDFGNSEIKTFNNIAIKKDWTVFKLLEKVTAENNIELTYKDYGGDLGVFIESIGGVGNDFNADKFWQYWVNNKYAEIGVGNYDLKNNDVIELKYIKGQLKN